MGSSRVAYLVVGLEQEPLHLFVVCVFVGSATGCQEESINQSIHPLIDQSINRSVQQTKKKTPPNLRIGQVGVAAGNEAGDGDGVVVAHAVLGIVHRAAAMVAVAAAGEELSWFGMWKA